MRQKRSSGVKWLVGILATLLIAVGAITLYIKNSIDQILIPTDDSSSIEDRKVDDDYNLNFLVMGVDNDERREKTGLSGKRTDSLMLITLNTKNSSLTMYNIPRDTVTVIYDNEGREVVEYGQYFNKINTAYESGGEYAVINTVEKLLPNIEIDYYGTFNFASFEQIVDAIGGVEIDVVDDIYDYKLENILINAGVQNLNGKQALDFARARYQDDDIQRGYRQQMIVKAIVEKSMKDMDIKKIVSILNAVKGNVVTNLSLGDIKNLYGATKGKEFEFNKVEADWTSFDLNGGSTVFLPKHSRAKVVSEINGSIGRDTSTVAINGGHEQETSLQNAMNEYEYYLYELGEAQVNSWYLDNFLDKVNYPPLNEEY